MKEAKRELGKISDFRSGEEDHGIITCVIGIDFNGSHQGFGCLALDEDLLSKFEQDVCDTFNVKTMDELIGKSCYALRCFGFHNDPIEGLESVDTGKRFTISSWRKKHVSIKHDSPLQRKIKDLKSRIESNRANIIRYTSELESIYSDYTDWG